MKEGGKISDYCKVIAGQSPEGKAYNADGIGMEFHQGKKAFGLRMLEISGVWTTSVTKVAKAGDILMSVRAPVGPTNITNREVCIGRGLAAIRCSERILPTFALYALKNIETTITGNDGAVFNSISKTMIEEIPIPIADLSEQRRIVSYLDTTFANIDKLKDKAATALTEAKILFQAALAEAMKPKEGWEEKTLGEICTIVGRIGFRGYTRKDIVSDKKDGAITLSPSNIVDGKMSYLNCTYISWYKYEESPEIKIYEGDILMVKTGSSYGKTAYVDYLPHKATINPQFVVLKDVKINKKYLSYQLKTKNTFDYIKSIVSGSAIPTFSQANLAKMELTVPPLSSQEQIVTRLDTLSSTIRKLEENYRRTLEECDALKQAVLREVFE